MMPTIYARWSLGICHTSGNNLFKTFPVAAFYRPNLGICTNLQKKHCIGEEIFLDGSGAPT